MTKFLYLMTEDALKKYLQIKTEMISARDGMNAEEIEVSKAQILKECKINDFHADSSEPQKLFEVKDGVAFIPVEGMLVNQVNFCDAFFGETLTTYRFIQEATLRADEDPLVNKIVFLHNSGGGVVSGVDRTAEIIRSAKKPTVSFVYDISASADIWLASASDEIISVTRTGFIGSIGVAVEIINRDKADEEAGIKRQTFTNTTSKDKRPDLLTEEGAAILIEEMDAVMDVFVESILIKRGDKLTKKSIEDMGGKVFIASKALELGLIDQLMTESEANDTILKSEFSVSADKNINKDGTTMNPLDEFLATNPEAKADYEKRITAAETKGKGETEAVIKTAVEANNKAIAEKLALSGMKLTDDLKVSIETGETLGDFAIREKKADIAAIEAAGNDDLGGLDGKDQTPTSPNTKKDIEAQDKKDVEEYIASQKKGAK